MSLKIMIVEDEPMIAEELQLIVQNENWKVVGKAYDYNKALDLLTLRNPDIVLLDIQLGRFGSGIDLAKIINEKFRIPIIFITSFTDARTMDMVKPLRPVGYIVKPFKRKDVVVNIQLASVYLNGGSTQEDLHIEKINQKLTSPLTQKEYELLMDLAKGKSNDELCSMHYISLNTVKTHLKSIYAKLDVSNRSSAILKVIHYSK